MNYSFEDLARLAIADYNGLLSNMNGECLDDVAEKSIYNEDLFECDGADYLIFETYSEAENAASECIDELLWAFNSSFLADETGIDQEVFDAIQANDRCESNNSAIRAIVEGTCGVDSLGESAISGDGIGHFLSSYDGDEIELNCKLTGATFYAYRTN